MTSMLRCYHTNLLKYRSNFAAPFPLGLPSILYPHPFSPWQHPTPQLPPPPHFLHCISHFHNILRNPLVIHFFLHHRLHSPTVFNSTCTVYVSLASISISPPTPPSPPPNHFCHRISLSWQPPIASTSSLLPLSLTSQLPLPKYGVDQKKK